ncbi:hypothetical protein ACWC24_33015 [Streptomyces sp. NPDC001443]
MSEFRSAGFDHKNGFELQSGTVQENFRDYRRYRITGGELRVRSRGKTSWEDGVSATKTSPPASRRTGSCRSVWLN